MVSGAWWATIHGVAKNDDDMTDDFYSQLFYSYSFFLSHPTYILNFINHLTVCH